MILDKLLKRLGSVFNKSPKAVSAIVCTGKTFTVADLVLTIQSHTFSLATMTLGELVTAMSSHGIVTSLASSSLSTVPARGLVDVAGGVGVMQLPTSILYTEMRTYAWELDDQNSRIKALELDMYLDSATVSWLDYWGDSLGVPRVAGESDARYSVRIVQDIIQPNQNNLALEIMIEQWLKNLIDVTVVDMYNLSGKIYYNGQYCHNGQHTHNNGVNGQYTQFRVDVWIAPDDTFSVVDDMVFARLLIDKNKAAGTSYDYLMHFLVEIGAGSTAASCIWQTVSGTTKTRTATNYTFDVDGTPTLFASCGLFAIDLVDEVITGVIVKDSGGSTLATKSIVPFTKTTLINFADDAAIAAVIPTAHLENPPDDPTFKLRDIFIVSSEDDCLFYKYKFDADATWTPDNAIGYSTIATSIDKTLVVGTHTLQIIGRSTSNLWQAVPTVYTWDIEAITCSLVNNLADITAGTSTDFTVVTNVDKYRYQLSWKTTGAYNPLGWSAVTNKSVDIERTGLTNNRTYKIEVKAIDDSVTPNLESAIVEFEWTLAIPVVGPWVVILDKVDGTYTSHTSATFHIDTSATHFKYRFTRAINNVITVINDWGAFMPKNVLPGDIGTELTFTGLGTAHYALTAVGWNPTEAASGAADSTEWNVDTTIAPLAVIVSGKPDKFSNVAPITDITIGGSNVVYYKYKLDAETNYTPNVTGTDFGTLTTTDITLTLAQLTTGTMPIGHTLYFKGQNAYGEWQDTDSVYTWSTDTRIPIVPLAVIVAGEPDKFSNAAPITDITIGGSNVVYYKYKLDAKTNYTPNVTGTDFGTLTTTDITLTLAQLTTGTMPIGHTLYFKGQNAYGEWQGTDSVYTWSTDTRIPVTTATPAGRELPLGGAADVALTCNIAGVSIYFTTDGHPPTPQPAYLYTVPIHIATATTLKFFAVNDLYNNTESIKTESYTEVVPFFAVWNIISQTSIINGLNRIAVHPAHDSILYLASNGSAGHIQKSIDSGVTWTNTGSDYYTIWGGLVVLGNGDLYAAEFNGPVWKSVDGGATFTKIPSVTDGWSGIDANYYGTRFIASSVNNEIYISTDQCETWTATGSGNLGANDVAISPDGLTMYACTQGLGNGQIHKSVDVGLTWSIVSPSLSDWYTITAANGGSVASSKLLSDAVTSRDVATSSDYGVSWQATNNVNLDATSLCFTGSGNKMYALDSAFHVLESVR